jgi:hypothetical protein
MNINALLILLIKDNDITKNYRSYTYLVPAYKAEWYTYKNVYIIINNMTIN